jgi:hypothetical protein
MDLCFSGWDWTGIITGMQNSPLYTVITLAEAMQTPSTRDWLALAGVHLPATTPSGRMPAPAEMKAVLENLSGVRVRYQITGSTWQASVTSRKDVSWASLRFRAYGGNPQDPQPFVFEDGWDEVILLVASRVARLCGPLVLLHDSGAAPQVVY